MKDNVSLELNKYRPLVGAERYYEMWLDFSEVTSVQ